MIFWIIAGVMTVAALAVVLVPLMRRQREPQTGEEHELAIYRDQLEELETDLTRRLIGPDQAESARLEIQRRMLAVSQASEINSGEAAPIGRKAWRHRVAGMAVLGVGMPALAISLYLTLGSPGLPSRPFDETDQPADTAAAHSIDASVAKLVRRLESQPDDLDGWVLLGRSYIAIQRYPEAMEALRRAVALSGNDPEVVAGFGEAIVFASDGIVVPEAQAAFERVLEIRPNDQASRYYVGLAHAQAGRFQEALNIWLRLAAQTPEDTPWRENLVQMIRRAADQSGIEVATIPSPAARSPAGPSAEDMAAAADMTPEEQAEMIRTMVENLAEKLEQNPEDLAGWQRLARAYRILGEDEKAEAAEQRIAKLQTVPPRVGGKPAATTDATSAPATPTGAEQQGAMVQAMVERLARRLEEEPNDLEGWLQLGRSYAVLGQHEEAREAYGAAVELAPEDPTVLTAYGRALIGGAPHSEGLPSEAVVVFGRILELEPNHPEALWFLGLAEAQAGNRDRARTLLERLLVLLPEGGRDRGMVEQALGELQD